LTKIANAKHIYKNLKTYRNRKLSYRRDSVTQGHPFLCQSTRHIWLPISTQ